MSRFSQKTLGLLRDILEDMEPKKATSTYAINEFWQKALFDCEFPNQAIRIMHSHNFNWVNIIHNLSDGTLGTSNSYFGETLVPAECGEVLESLVFFVMEKSKSDKISDLKKALIADGFRVTTTPEVDLAIPKELSDLPRPETMQADLDEMLRAGTSVALLFIDLDNFKSVNDQLGSHAEGDRCLIRSVAVMSTAIIHKGRLYRRSGDEFIIVLPNFDLREAAATAERIRASIEEARPGGIVKVTASIGVATS